MASALEQLQEIVLEMGTREEADQGPETGVPVNEVEDWAMRLSHVYEELNDNWIALTSDGDVPTPAQGVALARFMRPEFNGDRGAAGCFVARGGNGLSGNYLHVRFNSGYEGGIDKEGRVST